MAFLSKMGSLLKQSTAKHINLKISSSSPSLFQAIRSMSSSKIFIGGISFTTDEQSLREAFGNYGEVVEAKIIMDRESGRSKGYGFVTYTSTEEASSAIQALDGQDLHGRVVRVNYANERVRSGGFGGGYGGGGGGYGGGGGGEDYGGSGYTGGGYGGNTGGGYGGNTGGGYGGNTGGGYGGNTGGGYGGNTGGSYSGNTGGGYGENTGGGGYGGNTGGGYGENTSSGYGGNTGGGYGGNTGGGYGGNTGGGYGGEAYGGENSVASGSNDTFGGYGTDVGSGGPTSGATDTGFGAPDRFGATGSFNQGSPIEGSFRDDNNDAETFAKQA